MPFGAEPIATGGVRFRFWAPSAGMVDVMLIGPKSNEALSMRAQEDGWFELVTDHAHAGTRYRYRIDGGTEVPDPASRFNPQDVGGPSEVIDPHAFQWGDALWRGHTWTQAVIYELHVGTFTPEGTFRAAIARLPHLKLLGVTMVELMPIAEFPGARGWGYDGVLPYAPESATAGRRISRPSSTLRMAWDSPCSSTSCTTISGLKGIICGLYAKPFFQRGTRTHRAGRSDQF